MKESEPQEDADADGQNDEESEGVRVGDPDTEGDDEKLSETVAVTDTDGDGDTIMQYPVELHKPVFGIVYPSPVH